MQKLDRIWLVHNYRLLGTVGPPELNDSRVQTDHSGHPLQETVLTFNPRVVHAVTQNPDTAKTKSLKRNSKWSNWTTKWHGSLPLTSDIPPQMFLPSSEGSVELRTDISCAGEPRWALPLEGAAPRRQRPRQRSEKPLRGGKPPPPLLVSTGF